MRNYTRFIPGEEIDAVSEWRFGDVDTAAIFLAARSKAQDEALEQAAHEVLRQQGYAQGFSQGRDQAALELQEQMAAFVQNQQLEGARDFARLFEAARTQIDASQQAIARGLLTLACELARHVLRHELSISPNALEGVLREALGMLAADTKSAVVRLHPVDADLIGSTLHGEFAHLSLTVRADPSVSRGGCTVESGGTLVDGTLQRRWNRAIASLDLAVSWAESEDGA